MGTMMEADAPLLLSLRLRVELGRSGEDNGSEALPPSPNGAPGAGSEERRRSFYLPSVPFANPIGLLPEQYASIKEARRGILGHFGIPLAT